MPEAKIVRMQELEAPTGARIPVAWLDLGGRREVAVPLARLAEVVEYDRSTFNRLVEGDPVLSEYRVVVTTTREGVPHRTAFLQRPGVLGVLVKISTVRIQDPLKRERIQAFQRWAFESLDRLLFEGRVSGQPPLFGENASLPSPPAPTPKPSRPMFIGDRERAARMLVGEIRDRDGRLLSYGRIEAITGVPKTTLARMARRLGVHEWRANPEVSRILRERRVQKASPLLPQEKAHPDPSPEPLLREVARLLRQQTEALTALLRRLGA